MHTSTDAADRVTMGALATPITSGRRGRTRVERLVAAVGGIGLFVVALGMMKAGALALVPHLSGSAFTDGPWSALGFGWLGACLVLSGSPVAASSLTLLDAGVVDRAGAFAMLTGSRLGASFVVLVVGFVYAAKKQRGEGRRVPLTVGVLSLLMTAVAYIPGALLGFLLLNGGGLDGIHLAASPAMVAATDVVFGWATDLLQTFVPDLGLFPVGLAILLGAFKLFDRAMPALGSQTIEGRGQSWLRNPWAMFATGCGVAFLTMSVSVALTLLVPLVAKGYVRREDALPYVAGANITTLADTLAAAVLLGNQDAVRVVLAEVIGVTAWTVVVLGLLYGLVRPGVLRATSTVLARPRRLALFVAVLFAVPLALVAV